MKNGHSGGGGELWWEDCKVRRDKGSDLAVELRKGVEEWRQSRYRGVIVVM